MADLLLEAQMILHAARTLLTLPGAWVLVEPECSDERDLLSCEGYHWLPGEPLQWDGYGAVMEAGFAFSGKARLEALRLLMATSLVNGEDYDTWVCAPGRTLAQIVEAISLALGETEVPEMHRPSSLALLPSM